jgi:hypothetical protein
VLYPTSSIYLSPSVITIPPTNLLTMFSSASGVVANYMNPVPINVEVIGEYPGAGGNYTLTIEKWRFMLWGYNGTPSTMTTTGKQMFINSVLYAAQE